MLYNLNNHGQYRDCEGEEYYFNHPSRNLHSMFNSLKWFEINIEIYPLDLTGLNLLGC